MSGRGDSGGPLEPSADGGRDTSGRFTAGNKFGRGNPHAAAKLVLEYTVGRPAPTPGAETGDVPLIEVLGVSAEVWDAV